MEQRNKRNQGKSKAPILKPSVTAKKEQVAIKEQPVTSSNILIEAFQKWQFLIVFIFGALLYLNTLSFDYTLDDMLMIYKNKFTTDGVHGISKIMTTDAFTGFFGENKNLLTGGRYRPLSHVMFAIEWQLFKYNPLEGHLLNILLYGLLGVLVLKLLKKMFDDTKGSKWYLTLPFIATLLYLAHPIHTEVVANIKGRDELVTSILSLLTVYMAFLYVETNKLYYLGLVFLVYLSALFSKENALTFFAVVPLSVYFFKSKDYKKIALALTPMVLALIVYFATRFQLGLMNFSTKESELLNDPYLNATASDRYATVFYTLWMYIKLLIVPLNLTHDYYPKQIEIIGWANPSAIGSFLLYVGIGIVGLWGLIKRNIWGWLSIFYLATLSISSNLFFNIGAFMNERFIFTSSLAFSVLVAYLLKKYASKEKALLTILVVVLSLYSVKTFSRNYAWKDDFTLFTTDVLTSTNSAKVNTSAGGVLIERAIKEHDTIKKMELLSKASEYLAKATTIHPHYVQGWELYGNSFLYSNAYPQAIQCYENAIMSPGAAGNLLYVAQQTTLKKKYDISVNAYKVLLKYYPKNSLYRKSFATVLDDIGRWDTAKIILENVIKDEPNNSEAYNYLGLIYGKRLGLMDKSIELIEKARKLNPKDVSVYENLGVAYGFNKNYKASIEVLKKAIELNPKDEQAYVNISNSYRFSGDNRSAIGMLLKAIALNPKDAQAYLNISNCYLAIGDKTNAQKYLAMGSAIQGRIK